MAKPMGKQDRPKGQMRDEAGIIVRLDGELLNRIDGHKDLTGAAYQWIFEQALDAYLPKWSVLSRDLAKKFPETFKPQRRKRGA